MGAAMQNKNQAVKYLIEIMHGVKIASESLDKALKYNELFKNLSLSENDLEIIKAGNMNFKAIADAACELDRKVGKLNESIYRKEGAINRLLT